MTAANENSFSESPLVPKASGVTKAEDSSTAIQAGQQPSCDDTRIPHPIYDSRAHVHDDPPGHEQVGSCHVHGAGPDRPEPAALVSTHVGFPSLSGPDPVHSATTPPRAGRLGPNWRKRKIAAGRLLVVAGALCI